MTSKKADQIAPQQRSSAMRYHHNWPTRRRLGQKGVSCTSIRWCRFSDCAARGWVARKSANESAGLSHREEEREKSGSTPASERPKYEMRRGWEWVPATELWWEQMATDGQNDHSCCESCPTAPSQGQLWGVQSRPNSRYRSPPAGSQSRRRTPWRMPSAPSPLPPQSLQAQASPRMLGTQPTGHVGKVSLCRRRE